MQALETTTKTAETSLDRLRWPALLKYAGEAELVLIESATAWLDDADYHAFDYAEGDRLIDSTGARFALAQRVDARVVPTPLDGRADPGELSAMLRAHCAAIGACCVAKLSTVSAADVIELLAQLDDA